eukprot:scaffold9922_cov86-Isochrysis_galbana.AAC.3
MPGSLGEVRLGNGKLGGRLDVRTTAAPQSRPACCRPESGAPSPSNDCPVRPCGQTQSALSAISGRSPGSSRCSGPDSRSYTDHAVMSSITS